MRNDNRKELKLHNDDTAVTFLTNEAKVPLNGLCPINEIMPLSHAFEVADYCKPRNATNNCLMKAY